MDTDRASRGWTASAELEGEKQLFMGHREEQLGGAELGADGEGSSCLASPSGCRWQDREQMVPFACWALGVSFSAWVSDLNKSDLQRSSSWPFLPAPFSILHMVNPRDQAPALQPELKKLCVSWPLLCPVPTGCGNS